MSQVRISGLVSLANSVRQDMARPLTAAQIEQLRNHVRHALETVNSILGKCHATPADLPQPSQQAYQFLAGLDFSGLRPSEVAAAQHPAAPPVGSGTLIRMTGLRRYLDITLTPLSAGSLPADTIFDGIVKLSREVEEGLARQCLTAERLTAETRAIRGWLAFFADRANFDAYVVAIGRAASAFELARKAAKWNKTPPPVVLHFRPTRTLFSFKRGFSATTIWLPTPMICFDAALFAELAGLAFRLTRGRQAVVEAMAADAYQDIQAELEALGGVIEQTAGAIHDLAAAFERVNGAYFESAMAKPRLTWSRSLTRRKFGHYDPIRDTVMVSSTLDQPGVPEFVVDYIMFHELLHKKLGISWQNGQARVHTADFKAEDRRFAQYEQAEAILKRLAGSSRCGPRWKSVIGRSLS